VGAQIHLTRRETALKPRTATIIITAALALVGASGCGSGTEADVASADAPARAPAGPTIAVVGDSITEQSKNEIDAYTADRGLGSHVDATSGFMTREKQDAAAAIASTHPAAAVIALGTNDAVCQLTNALISGSCRYAGFTIADMEADLDRMAETLRQPGTCVVGVTVYFGEEVGQHLDSMVDAGFIDGIVDWRSVVNADDSLRADGIGHLTAKGENRYARFVVDETARICGI
jgi:hypothetical protein